jgi:hypothetical protein
MVVAVGTLGTFSNTTPPLPANETDSDAFNKLMSDVSANGTSKETLQQDAAAFERASGGKDSATENAVKNMVNSLGDGTYSQQGTQGALEGAATKDQIANITNMPLISGTSGLTDQNGGFLDGGGAKEKPLGSLGANANILYDEIKGGAPKDQIINNATALEKEATNAGNTTIADAAKKILDSENSGTPLDAQTVHDMFKPAFDAADAAAGR